MRYASLEQLKKQADLTNGFIVHLMRKTVKDDILRLYRDLQGLGFKVEDMTVPFSSGLRSSVLPEVSRN